MPAAKMLRTAAGITHWICENAKSARAYLKRIDAIAPLAAPLQAQNIQELPRDLGEAITLLKRSAFVRDSLGEHVFQYFVAAKEREWQEYIAQVHDWEIERYLNY